VSTGPLHRWYFLKGKYKGIILTGLVAGSNNQLLPLAIAFVEGENGDSWY
jgi:hypothetical protein